MSVVLVPTTQHSVHLPEACPVCLYAIEPRMLTGCQYVPSGGTIPDRLEAAYLCPRSACARMFVAAYTRIGDVRTGNTPDMWSAPSLAPSSAEDKNFSSEIRDLSPQFPLIYNQAFHAEQLGLDLICGPGYRKALEFLVKDYSKARNPGHEASIEKKQLGTCIREYIEYEHLKALSERAAWLGNDETHYLRRWTEKDVKDLKKIIELVVHWISLHVLSEEVIKSMPDSAGTSI